MHDAACTSDVRLDDLIPSVEEVRHVYVDVGRLESAHLGGLDEDDARRVAGLMCVAWLLGLVLGVEVYVALR